MKFPKATVSLREAKPIKGKKGTYSAKGTISVREVKVEGNITFQYDPENNHRVWGELPVSRTALTVGAPVKKGDPRSIEDTVKVTFDVNLPKVPAK